MPCFIAFITFPFDVLAFTFDLGLQRILLACHALCEKFVTQTKCLSVISLFMTPFSAINNRESAILVNQH